MLVRAKGLAAVGVVLGASLASLVLKGSVEWATDLLVAASAGLAGRLRLGDAAVVEGWPERSRRRCRRRRRTGRWTGRARRPIIAARLCRRAQRRRPAPTTEDRPA